jgi:hypothetical protein
MGPARSSRKRSTTGASLRFQGRGFGMFRSCGLGFIRCSRCDAQPSLLAWRSCPFRILRYSAHHA